MDTSVLERTAEYFAEHGASNTVREILHQPRLWNELCDWLTQNRAGISRFMEKAIAEPSLRIVFTGAGSSAFIGESLQNMLAQELGIYSETVHTTDIVSAPDCVLYDVPTLLVSYSRSGESPESVGAIRYAQKKIQKLYNMVLVCKKDSSLQKYAEASADTLVLDMPPESSDLGFAMTSSVSCMALATWCVFDWKNLDKRIAYIRQLANCAAAQFTAADKIAREIAAADYSRVIYLGSGKLRGLARESAVKSLELTNGCVNANFDSAAGFRHGPKTAVVPGTLTVHYIAADSFTQKYDLDLLTEMLAEKKQNYIVAVAPSGVSIPAETDAVYLYPLPDEAEFSGIGSYVQSLLFAQLLSVEKSLNCGMLVDTPCIGGEVNRVVKGVTIYEL